ncbi:MAG TPA: recombinase family protein [Planosporangium sp.]|nr:recombinase family protein [Planosporangium sp.]
MRAAVYLRISDDREGRELGAGRQRADCLRLAGRLGVDVVEVYQDDDTEAFGRDRERRPAYRRMLADAGARRFGSVIAYTSARLAERRGEYEDLIELAQRHGIRFAYVMSAASEPGVGSAVSPLVPIVGAVNTFRRLASDLAPDLKGLFADAAPAIEPLAEGVAGFVRNAMPGVRGLVRQSTPYMAHLSRSLPPLGHAVGAFLSTVSPGAPGASAFVTDVIDLAAGQSLFWGEVIRRLSQTYLTVRGFVGDVGEAFAALPERTRRVVLNLFDRATTAIGVGIGAALRSHTSGFLPEMLRERLAATLDAANSAASALVVASVDVLANLPALLGKTAGDLGDSVRGAGARLRDEGRDIVVGGVGGVLGSTASAADFAAATGDRAVANILAGMKSGLSTGPTDEVVPWMPTDTVTADAGPAPVGAMAAAPQGITVNGLNINVYGMWDPTDSAAVDRVVAGIYQALSPYRREYA